MGEDGVDGTPGATAATGPRIPTTAGSCPALLTVTDTAAEVVTFPAASLALAVMVCAPALAVVLFHVSA